MLKTEIFPSELFPACLHSFIGWRRDSSFLCSSLRASNSSQSTQFLRDAGFSEESRSSSWFALTILWFQVSSKDVG